MQSTTRWALAGLSLSMMLSTLGTSIANVALPTLAVAFDATFAQVRWVVVSYLVAITASVVIVGRLGDRIGRRRLLRAGLVVFTVASVVSGVASALWLVIAARAAQGLGAAVMMALATAFVGELVPKDKSGSAMGLLGTMSAVGTALGPSLGGALIAVFGWRAIFFVSVPLGLVAVWLVHRYLPVDGPAPERVGELKASSLLMPFGMLREPALSASLAANLLVATVLMATLVVGPFHLSLALGLPAAQVGLVMSIGPIVAALTGVPAGRMVDRFGMQRMITGGLVGIAAGSFMLAILPETLGVAGYVVPVVVITAAYALFQAANNAAVMRDVSASQRGVVSGMLNLSRNLGLVAGASVMGAVFARAGMRITFAVAGALMMIALAIVLDRRRSTGLDDVEVREA